MAAGEEEDFTLQQAISFVNNEFGTDLKKLSKAETLYKEVKSKKELLERQLSLASSEAPSKVENAVKQAEDAASKIEEFSVEHEHFCGDISNYMADVTPLVKKLSALTDQIKMLERYSSYLQVVARIEDLSSDIQSAMLVNSTERSVVQFAEMAELVKTLQGSECKHLVVFANDTVVFWYKILRDKLAREFEEVLEAWRWPFIVSTTKLKDIQNVAEIKDQLGPLFINLLHLQLPDGLSSEGQPSHPFLLNLPDWRPILLPLQFMLTPLRKRFRFHFYGNKQTNNPEKPEWYLTQILTWIKDHREFLRSRIQPLLEQADLGYIDIVAEFSRGLVVLVMEKLLADIPELMYDDGLFSHLVAEVLAFDRELRLLTGSVSSLPCCLHVLTQDQPFSKWLALEKKYILEKMDAMLTSPSAWVSLYKDMADVDELKVPECGEKFMTLMQTMTERYKPLPYPQHRLQFLDAQLYLMDDYRIRLLQVRGQVATDPLSRGYTAILNTASSIAGVLKEWNELLFFVQLQYYKQQARDAHYASQTEAQRHTESHDECGTSGDVTEGDGGRHRSAGAIYSQSSMLGIEDLDESKLQFEGGVFDETVELFERMKNEMLYNIVSYVTDDVKARSRPYRREKWLTLPSQKDFVSLGLSNSACEMLLVLKELLHQVEQLLSKALFDSFWRMVAENLNTFIFKEVILQNNFNDGGATQLQFDMTRNLFPLFGQYTPKPENYFKDVKEACHILTLNTGSALLLKDVLYKALHEPDADPRNHVVDPVLALQEQGIFKLSLEQAELVLSLRTNLSTT